MKINYYTITSNNYYPYTELMLKSFINSGSDGNMYILTIDTIKNPIEFSNIEHLSCESIINSYGLNKQDIHLLSWWMKSRSVLFSKIIDTEYICYVDSDVLFFKNISKFILQTITQHGNKYFYTANDGVKIYKKPLINSGFYFTNIAKYPYIDLMNLWHEEMIELLNNRLKNSSYIYKYLDQFVLRNCLIQEKYSQYKILDPYIIGYRRHSNKRVLTHYIKKFKNKMPTEYKQFVKKNIYEPTIESKKNELES